MAAATLHPHAPQLIVIVLIRATHAIYGPPGFKGVCHLCNHFVPVGTELLVF
jgi:hypothetical protein